MNALCLVIDGLQAGYLGCYGNSWVQTPALDRLATQSFLLDQALIDSPHLDDALRAYWQGVHALTPAERNLQLPTLSELLKAAGVSTALLTDDPAAKAHHLAQSLDEIVLLPSGKPVAATHSEETQLAVCFSAAAEWLEQAREPFCLWLHCGSLFTSWDAPLALRERYAEEDNLAPATFVDPPRAWLSGEQDPDELLRLRWAYAAQVTVLDRCLEALLEWFDTQPAAGQTLLVVLGARGYPLGEHGRVGQAEAPLERSTLHAELIHVPCLLRMPDGAGAMDRSSQIVQPAGLAATLADWFEVPMAVPALAGASWLPLVRGQDVARQERACVVDRLRGEVALRTPAWYMIQLPGLPDPPDPPIRELYVKPDDRWELNEVADRCSGIAELLANALQQCEQAAQEDSLGELPPLDEVLVEGLE